ncbi:phosphoserine phosphatase SerB [Agilicoccus flavus]|uniref:phosphoserine phosphatase SerB n=1 Tax=Agilicoccus flavus TaxID=2775968 RepID=UPI001CF6103A|nr:phosphoserine phosphatase SerB [Agilicoccus flavus]
MSSHEPASPVPDPALDGPRLVVLDVDSTFIRDEVVELLAGHAGPEAAERVAAVTEAAMRGELDFAASLRARVATLAGLPTSVFADVLAAVRPTPGAAEFVAALHARGDVVALVSGGFAEVVEPLAARYGIGLVRANRLTVRDGRLTGELDGPVVDRAAKAAALAEFAAERGIPAEATVAVGDGANDIDMVEAAGLGIAFAAKPVLRARADAVVDEVDLRAVLPLLGLPHDDRAGPRI